MLDHGEPLVRNLVRGDFRIIRGLTVETRCHVILNQLVEGSGLNIVAFIRAGLVVGGGDRPAVLAVVHLVPPAVQHRQVQATVHGGLHAGRAARLKRTERIVQPHVTAREQHPCHGDVVIGEEHYAVANLGIVREAHQILDHALAHFIGGVGFTRHNQLNGVVRIEQQLLQTRGVAQHEGQALISGHAACEPDGQHIRVQHGVRPRQLRVGGAALLPGSPQATSNVVHQALAQIAANLPQVLVAGLVDLAPA